MYQPTAGVAAMFGGAGEPRRVEGILAAGEHDVRVAAVADRPVLVAVVQHSGELFKVDFETRGVSPRVQLAGRAGGRFGPPVLSNGLVYVPDQRNHHVVVAELDSLREIRAVTVPGEADIELVVRDGWVWANNPYGGLFSFDREGRPRELDGGDDPGDQAPDRNPPEAAAPEPEPERPAPDRPEPTPEPAPTGILPSPEDEVPPTTVVPPPGVTVDQTCPAVVAAVLTCEPFVAGYAASTAEFHRVVSYEPAAGTELPVESVVRVGYLVQPGEITVPSVVGLSPNDACQTLQASFLQCAPVADYPTATLNVVQHQDIAAGSVVPTGSSVPYYYEDIGPVPIGRYKLIGEESRYLTLGAPPAGRWSAMPTIGQVYSPAETGVPGLIAINQFHCQPNCVGGQSQGYYYQGTTTPPTGRWQLDGPAFRCFADPVPGTLPLQAGYSDSLHAWAFAPFPSGEYDHHAAPENGGYTNWFTICHISPR